MLRRASLRPFVALLSAALLLASYAGCVSKAPGKPGDSSGTGGSAFSGGEGASPPASLPGLVSLAVTPATSTISLVYASPVVPAQQPLVAMGTFKDGTTKDVTTQVGWTTLPATASVSNGSFSSSVVGLHAVTAVSGAITGSASVTVKLTGSASLAGASSAQAGLDGAPGGAAPVIAYPLDGAIFPLSLAPLELQMVPGSAAQTVGRVAISGDLINLRVYAPCTPISSAAIAGACTLSLPADLQPQLAGASEGAAMSTQVRLAASDGSGAGESTPTDVRWAPDPLHGGLYFWSAQAPSQGGANLLMRYDLDQPGSPAETYYTNADTAKLDSSTQYYQPCFGCHAISKDGTKLALTFGGSVPSLFALFDVSTKTVLKSGTQQALRISDGDAPGFMANSGFATTTTFSPDGTAMVQAFRGQLLPRAADATLADLGPPLFTSTIDPLTELLTEPYWSPAGDNLVFTSAPSSGGGTFTGDEISGAQIWIAPVKGTSFGTPKLLVPRVAQKAEYYPTISDDGTLVAFNESSCNGPPTPSVDGWGAGACDSYDDPSARLRLVLSAGGAPIELPRANGADTWTNSWPRFSPTHTTFHGKTLYWVAFSSRRPYGATIAGSNVGNASPQLWFAGVLVGANGAISGDPSFAPVWMPGQNTSNTSPGGNHVPQWVEKAVMVVTN